MPKLSAGLLLYRIRTAGVLEVLIAHPGGPFWAKKDDGAWSIPKGEYEPGDDPHAAALREFEEELGGPPPQSDDLPLGEVKQPSGKVLIVWAREGDFDASTAKSNLFEMEWPRGSGHIKQFPEIDRAAWFNTLEAKRKLLKGHAVVKIQAPMRVRLPFDRVCPRKVAAGSSIEGPQRSVTARADTAIALVYPPGSSSWPRTRLRGYCKKNTTARPTKATSTAIGKNAAPTRTKRTLAASGSTGFCSIKQPGMSSCGCERYPRRHTYSTSY